MPILDQAVPSSPITIDAHMDCPWVNHKWCEANPEPGSFNFRDGDPCSIFKTDDAKLGGLQAGIWALYLSDAWQNLHTEGEIKAAIRRQIYRIVTYEGTHRTRTLAEVEYVATGNLFPVMLGLEGGRLIHNSLTYLEMLAKEGLKYLTLVHNRNTPWADSATDVPNVEGLTLFGKEVVKKCNELGVLVDVSHASDDTAWAAIETSTEPVIATHSGVRYLVKHPRNLNEDLILAIGGSGGMVCVPYAKRFIGCKTIAHHIDELVCIIGIDHVGIGSDIDGAVMVPGFNSVSQWKSAVVPDLKNLGYSDESIAKVLGGNLQKLLKKVEKPL